MTSSVCREPGQPDGWGLLRRGARSGRVDTPGAPFHVDHMRIRACDNKVMTVPVNAHSFQITWHQRNDADAGLVWLKQLIRTTLAEKKADVEPCSRTFDRDQGDPGSPA